MDVTPAAVNTRVSVIVPTYNEVENVSVLVQRILTVMPDAEIIVVDDASPDGTAARAREFAEWHPVKVVERKGERGLSTAVLRGLDEAQSDICIVMDADLSHPPEAIPALVKAVAEGAEVAVGSRYMAGGQIGGWPLLRRLTSQVGTLLARPLTNVCDPLAGFFCLRRSLLRGVELKPRGFKILLEILARTQVDKVVEVPIRFADRGTGMSKFSRKEQREYLAQLWSLYTELNAWPLRLAKFLVTEMSGLAVNLGVLATMVELLRRNAYGEAAVAAWLVAMTWNYTLNRLWTFRARTLPVLGSYLRYGLGVLAGLGVQLGVMHTLLRVHYVLAATLGIMTGTLFNYAASELWAFAKQRGSRRREVIRPGRAHSRLLHGLLAERDATCRRERMLTENKKDITVGVILVLAAIPRLWAAFYDQGIFWPDEIFQTLEPAHRFAFGYGFVAWEFQDGARSWLFPGFIGIVWKLAAWLGFESGPALVILAKVVMVVLSLVSVYVSMRLAEELAGPTAARLTGALTAACPAFLVYASRAMTEMASGPLLVAAAFLTLRSGRANHWTAGALATLACYARYQNGLFALGLLVLLLAHRRWWDVLHYAGGAIVVGLVGGGLDWLTWGRPYHSFWVYVQYNLIEGKSSLYGTAPFHYYLSVAWSSTGLALIAILVGFLVSWVRAQGLWLLVVAYVLAHCLVPHKEFRFLMPIAPLFLALAGTGLAIITEELTSWRFPSTGATASARPKRHKGSSVPEYERPRAEGEPLIPTRTPWLAWIMALLLCAVMGRRASVVTFASMGQYRGSPRGSPLGSRSPWHWQEEINVLFWKAAEQRDLCGLGLIELAPVWTGGYTYLHRDVPVLMIPVRTLRNLSPEGLGPVNYLVSPLSVGRPEGYSRVAVSNDLGLFRRSGTCSPPPENYWLLPKG